MTSDAKLGLLSGLAAVVLVAVVYYQKSDAAKLNSPQQQTHDKGNSKPKRIPASVDGNNGGSDPIIHIPNRTPATKPDVFIRPEIAD